VTLKAGTYDYSLLIVHVGLVDFYRLLGPKVYNSVPEVQVGDGAIGLPRFELGASRQLIYEPQGIDMNLPAFLQCR
jgi:hypothetical protein